MNFIQPDFSDGSLEFRIENGEVCIYGTSEGLRWLSEKCLALVSKGQEEHLHIEDYQQTTSHSAKATIALFNQK